VPFRPATATIPSTDVVATASLTRSSFAALVAAWLGWGFDVFDALLFSFVARPTLATLMPGSTDDEVNLALAVLSSLFLVGWATGGILFGRITDRLGRTRTLLITMITYSVATAACALSPNIYLLAAFRVIASLGVGGEWAAGASLVSEALPDRWRIWGGALLFTASPMGLVLANAVNNVVVQGWFAHDPEMGWRMAFLSGLLPAAFAFVIRLAVKEPERFRAHAGDAHRGELRELFHPPWRRRTVTALVLATSALVTWWGVGVFLPKLLPEWAAAAGLRGAEAEAFAARGNDLFNFGGVAGALLTAPIALWVGRRPAFALYFTAGLGLLGWTFGFDHSHEARQALLFFVGVTVYGIFAIFAYYLPELYPTRLRGTGAGFCYNTGRYLAAAGPLFTGTLSREVGLTQAVTYLALFYVLGLLALPFAVETRGAALLE
jgi:MFS family permease